MRTATTITTATGKSTSRPDTRPSAPLPGDPGYLRDPAAITARSFELIREQADLDRLPGPLRPLAARIVHACGMPEVAAELVWSGDPATAGRRALERGAPILVDATMVAAGISAGRLSRGNEVACTLGDPRVPALAAALGTTRSAAAVELWRERLDGAVVAIGNAPTALFHLLEHLPRWGTRPAVIFAFPVGFVGAAESKAALMAAQLALPWLTLPGRRGGSAMAAASINALGRVD